MPSRVFQRGCTSLGMPVAAFSSFPVSRFARARLHVKMAVQQRNAGRGRGRGRGRPQGNDRNEKRNNSPGNKYGHSKDAKAADNNNWRTQKQVPLLPSLDLPVGSVGKWYECVPELPDVSGKDRKRKSPKYQASAEQLKTRAMERLESDIARHDSKADQRKGSTTNSDFLRKVISSGTLTDKMASMLLMIQEAPMHRLPVLDALLKMAGRKGKREAIMAIDTLKDLFLSDLLPDRKLSYFHEQPIPPDGGAGGAAEERALVFWYFEDAIKRRYAQFVEHLEGAMHDALPHVKKKACRVTFDLLRAKPEQAPNPAPQRIARRVMHDAVCFPCGRTTMSCSLLGAALVLTDP